MVAAPTARRIPAVRRLAVVVTALSAGVAGLMLGGGLSATGGEFAAPTP